jgi:hypothetical protein
MFQRIFKSGERLFSPLQPEHREEAQNSKDAAHAEILFAKPGQVKPRGYLRITAVIAAGMTDRLREVAGFVALLEAEEQRLEARRKGL